MTQQQTKQMESDPSHKIYEYPTYIHITDGDYDICEFLDLNYNIYLNAVRLKQTTPVKTGFWKFHNKQCCKLLPRFVNTSSVEPRLRTLRKRISRHMVYVRFTKKQSNILRLWYDINPRLGTRSPMIIKSLIGYGRDDQCITEKNMLSWFKNEKGRRKAASRLRVASRLRAASRLE